MTVCAAVFDPDIGGDILLSDRLQYELQSLSKMLYLVAESPCDHAMQSCEPSLLRCHGADENFNLVQGSVGFK